MTCRTDRAFRPFQGVQRERLAHDFGTKSSVLYPSRRGTGGNGRGRESSPVSDRAEKEERQMPLPASVGRTFSESRDGDSPLPGLPGYNKGGSTWHTPFYDLPNTRAARPRR